MPILVGFAMAYRCPQPTPMLLVLNIHYSRASDVVKPDLLVTDPPVPIGAYRDLFGNWCSRIVAPRGRIVLRTDALVNDSGLPDVVVPTAVQTPGEQLPESTLVYLLGSRHFDTARPHVCGISEMASMRARTSSLRLVSCVEVASNVDGHSRWRF